MEPSSSALKSESSNNYEELKVPPNGYPYHAFEANGIEPCSVFQGGYSLPVHMLTCGHIVAVDSLGGAVDNRCGLNCLHVASWVKHQTMNAPLEHIDLRTGTSLGQALTSTAALRITKDPILPAIDQHQSHDNIFCEICHGIPASSYFVIPREVKRALAFTRPVIEHYTGFTNEQIVKRLCKPFYNPNQLGYDWKLPHILRCGHEVWAQPARACAANCSDTPECKNRTFLGNKKQGDVIFCHECVYRAEMVYERYAQVGKAMTYGASSHMGLQGVLVPEKGWDIPQAQVGSTYGVATAGFGDYPEYIAADRLPPDSMSEGDSSFPSPGAEA
ncbi:uncharacterized protein N0V89_000918 [Didymosphaeria variabile]|uniref:Uncharacterized protein n=1 Tax=Didymosphaeria variabile TaxID=1932322 RepID=A0A9W8XW82_9PLEO|nr:uncharacterized protein N0V89_000918 [Didymosphaeria variabile]KAJ4360356.1 hypothetical protein N0V89_000918 [Didymosphaeria variabile]